MRRGGIATGSIAGVVTDGTTPIANARVRFEEYSAGHDPEIDREPRWITSDASGAYLFSGLRAAGYAIHASAASYCPGSHRPGGDPVVLSEGQQLTGIDIVLASGGVEITGVVVDHRSAPIPDARVESDGGMAETATDGSFSLWVSPGSRPVKVAADGYVDGRGLAHAPGRVAIRLMPGARIAGTVVDAASGLPVEGVEVTIDESGLSRYTYSDAHGAFRFSRLRPERYSVFAEADRRYGRSNGSVRVGLGEQIDGVVVTLHPVALVEGRVVDAATREPCKRATVGLVDTSTHMSVVLHADATGIVSGFAPRGTYRTDPASPGFVAGKYEDVVVGDADVTGLAWELRAGARIEGRVLRVTGVPVAGAIVGGDNLHHRGDAVETAEDGRYALVGLAPGTWRLGVIGDDVVTRFDEVAVEHGHTVHHDLVVDDAGAIAGVIVDRDGHPVAGVKVTMRSGDDESELDNPSDNGGGFHAAALRPGEYEVLAEDSTTRVRIRANEVATVTLVVDARGVITGLVTDARGTPIADALVEIAGESYYAPPVVTELDGTFAIGGLAAGDHTVRAVWRGVEAIAKGIPMGGHATLQLAPTGSIAGVVRLAGRPPEHLAISVAGVWRSEKYFRTAGHFVVGEVPAGSLVITARAEGAYATTTLELAAGERKEDLAIELTRFVTLVGRVVDHATGAPVPGILVSAHPVGSHVETIDRTDAAGRFRIRNARVGTLAIGNMNPSFAVDRYGTIGVVRDITGTGTIDIGDVPIYKFRTQPGEPVGTCGFDFDVTPAGLRIRTTSLAASLTVGDVITTIDGVDITGHATGHAATLL